MASRLDALESMPARVAKNGAGSSVLSRVTSAEAASLSSGRDGSPSSGGDAATAPAPADSSLASEDLARLRPLVEDLIADRERELQTKAEAVERRIAELSEGPYGALNLQVNSMAAYLELSPQQKESLFRVLEAWTRRLEDEVTATTMGETTSEDSGEAFELERAAIGEAVDRQGQTEVLAVLSPSQRELFEGLSPEARSLEGDGAGGAPER